VLQAVAVALARYTAHARKQGRRRHSHVAWPQCHMFEPIQIGQLNSNEFEFKSNHSNFIWSKLDFPVLRKFKIKYGCEGFEEWNNFLYRNFPRFKMDFKWKIREASRFRIQ
jgi:hypothetical protein